MIFWNNLEGGSNKIQYKVIRDFINGNIKDKGDKLDIISEYFWNRYKNDKHNYNDLLKKHNLKEYEKKLHYKIKNYFKKDLDELSFIQKKEMISYIIYRFRNRLFHGEKIIAQDQNKNFIVINNFLYSLLKE